MKWLLALWRYFERNYNGEGVVNFGQHLPAAVREADSLYSFLRASSKIVCLLYVFMTDYLFSQTFGMHSRSGAK